MRRYVCIPYEAAPGRTGWVVWDRIRKRIADGCYFVGQIAKEQTAFCNLHPEAGNRDWFNEQRGERWLNELEQTCLAWVASHHDKSEGG